MTDQNNSSGAPAAISPQSSVLHACVRAAWQYGHRDRSELTDAERYERADYYATNALRVWGLTNVQEDDLTGPTAWRHRLPEGRQFLGGRTTQVLESLQQALNFKDRFGGELEPLFELEECFTNGGRNRGGETDLRHRETRMDTGSDRGGEPGARQRRDEAQSPCTLSERLRHARAAIGLTQDELAAKSGLSQSTIAQIETGRNVGTRFADKLAPVLGVSISWLMTGRDLDAADKAQRDADEIAAIWEAACAIAAMYVEEHCVDGTIHAHAIMTMKRPKITPSPTDKEALRQAALDEARGLLPALAKEHFNRTDVSEEFLNGLAYGACAYVAAIKKLQEGVEVDVDSSPKLDQAVRRGQRSQAYEIPTGRPMLHDIGAAMDAAALDAAAEGHPDASKPANEGGEHAKS